MLKGQKKTDIRICKGCGIIVPFGSYLESPKNYQAGRICKVCLKEYKRKTAIERYHLNKPNRAKEPEKYKCSECDKTFWSSQSPETRTGKKTCSKLCAKKRKYRLDKGRKNDL